MTERTLTHIDLFSGIGGFSLASHWTGRIRTTAHCEIKPYCQAVLRKHWPHVPIFEDIRSLTPQSLHDRGVEPPDLITGGFPCQGISIAGRGEGLADPRSGLWHEMLRVINELRPRLLLIENVPRLRTLGADTVLEGLEAAGYACEPLVVGADDIGAPHRRKRVWIPARLADAYGTGWQQQRGSRPGGEELATSQCNGKQAIQLLMGNAITSGQRRWTWRRTGTRSEDRHRNNGAALTGLDRAVDELPSRMDCHRFVSRPGEAQKDFEAPRTGYGIPNRPARLKAIGNSIDPIVAYMILMAMLDNLDY